MDNSAMIEKAKQIVVDYFNNHKDKTDHVFRIDRKKTK